MKDNKITIINRTRFATRNITEIAGSLLQGQLVPNFYLICEPLNCNGIALTNLDKPTIIIFIKDLGQFAETFVHELMHLQQHSENRVDEHEAAQREIVISDKNNPKGKVLNCKGMIE